jgi:hypothetical protein
MATAVQNKLEGAFKIGIRPKTGYRLKAEVSFKELFFFSLKPSACLCPFKTLFWTGVYYVSGQANKWNCSVYDIILL